MEISTTLPYNPIVQDRKKGALRYVLTCVCTRVYAHRLSSYINFPDRLWNYGAFPQTWENPNEVRLLFAVLSRCSCGVS